MKKHFPEPLLVTIYTASKRLMNVNPRANFMASMELNNQHPANLRVKTAEILHGFITQDPLKMRL